MKTLFFLSIFFIVGAMNNTLNAQKHYDIQLTSISQNIQTEICYDVQLRNTNLSTMNLGGQNYRLYYDASILKLEEEKSTSLLSTDNYSPLILKENIHNVDATGVGNLLYESNLGFLNFAMDLNNITTGGVDLPSDGAWMTTSRICFKVLGEADLSDQILYWARKDLTQEYATAFVEVSEWVSPNLMIPALAENYFDAVLTSVEKNILDNSKINLYPNPTIDKIIIEMDFPNAFEIELWNTAGILVINKHVDRLQGKYVLDLKNLPTGIYSVLIHAGTNRFFRLIEKANK